MENTENIQTTEKQEQMFDPNEIERAFETQGMYASTTRGTSMVPLFRTHRDIVIVTKPERELKKYDVALYHGRNGNYVLHRVIKVKEDEYIIRGDNTFIKEHVKKENVIGILQEFVRKGKTVSATNKKYLLYAKFWNFIYPLRYLYHLGRRVLAKIYHLIFKRK